MMTNTEHLLHWYGSADNAAEGFANEAGDWVAHSFVKDEVEQLDYLETLLAPGDEPSWEVLRPGFWVIRGNDDGFVAGERFDLWEEAKDEYEILLAEIDTEAVV